MQVFEFISSFVPRFFMNTQPETRNV